MDRLVEPETPSEMVRGRLEAMACSPAHGDPHCRLDFLITAHARPGWVGSTDLLTRCAQDSDFASDTCIRQEGIDPQTQLRYLEEIAFEIVNEQSPASVKSRAEDWAQVGIRRIFAVYVKRQVVAEWNRRAGGWEELDRDEVIEDERCLVRPLPVRAILERAVADNAAAQALIDKKVPAIERYREVGRELGHEAGHEAGTKEGLRRGILAILEARGLTPSPGLLQRIHTCDDAAVLERTLRSAAIANSVADLL